jgi:hypothetical protein
VASSWPSSSRGGGGARVEDRVGVPIEGGKGVGVKVRVPAARGVEVGVPVAGRGGGGVGTGGEMSLRGGGREGSHASRQGKIERWNVCLLTWIRCLAVELHRLNI